MRRRGLALEYVTLSWNLIGIAVLAASAISARSAALAGLGLDSLIEIGASSVVIWELSRADAERRQRGLLLIGVAFTGLAVYVFAQATAVLMAGYHPGRSVPGIIWTATTAAVMFALAAGKTRVSQALGDPVFQGEAQVTMIAGILAASVLLGLIFNAWLGWWWADPVAGYIVVLYAVRQVRELLFARPEPAS